LPSWFRSLWVTNGAIEPPITHRRSPLGRSRLVILIHGYNNDKQKAEKNYELLRAKLRHLVDAHRLEAIWRFYWPGYVEGLLPAVRRHLTQRMRRTRVPTTEGNLLMTAPLYALQVLKAREVGAELGRYLLQLASSERPSELVLIGHSLGCRVALEAVQQFTGAPAAQRGRVKGVCLMAAAVPTYMIESDRLLGAAARVPQRTWVLYSRKDLVLRWLFGPGQTAAREGFMPTAVGRHGTGVWTATDETMLGHGEYWGSSVTTPHLARAFGRATREELPNFDLVEWPSASSRDLPESELPTHGSQP
jgi:pimeloyl-ACP methyl ester carboxylesterase